MSSKLSKREQEIYKILGPDLGSIIFNKLKNDIDDINSIKKSDIINMVYHLCNYVDSTTISYESLDAISLTKIQNIWINFFNQYKKTYDTQNYIEKNKIILDYRENGIGFYWIDLQKLFCIESMLRMEDCGRVNYGHTTLELREQTKDSNISHMIIVYETESGNIRQVKGKSNSKPNESVWVWFYKFLLDTDYKINKYIPTYKPENDLTLLDFNSLQKSSIYIKHPNLNKPTTIL